jgi:hypothetical protein
MRAGGVAQAEEHLLGTREFKSQDYQEKKYN